MPIKELITFGMISVATIAVTGTGGIFNLKENLLKSEIAIMREVARTDTWGNPSIFPREFSKFKNRGRVHAELRVNRWNSETK